MFKHFIKPFGDFFIASFLLIILSPIILLTAILLFFANNGKVFFFQQRPGLNCKPFKIVKFKTMRDAFDDDGVPLPDDVRLTRVGSIVRSASLDELLQLINVLKGDMSLIGPRPLLPEYLPLYNQEQSRRHCVTPGITGWAQVNGRNGISWDKKFKYDVWYVDHISFILDLKIFFQTLKKVIISEGINAENEATIEPFSIE